MRAPRTADYLDHMLEPARQSCSYVEGLSKEDFLLDKRTQQAVILNLVILGEAAPRRSETTARFSTSTPACHGAA